MAGISGFSLAAGADSKVGDKVIAAGGTGLIVAQGIWVTTMIGTSLSAGSALIRRFGCPSGSDWAAVLPPPPQRLLTVFGLGHLVGGAAEQIAENFPTVLFVLNHKDVPAHDGLACCSTLVGTVNENVEPCPGLDSTHSRPPCNSMMRLAIASPSPVPPFFFVIEESAC